MTITAVNTILDAAHRALALATGGTLTEKYWFYAYVDHFAVNQATLTDAHRATLDAWITALTVSGWPFRPVGFRGMASQTGPEPNNLLLGRQRAQNVHDYLAAHLGAGAIEPNIDSVGSSKPRPGFDKTGSEFPENRAVLVMFEREMSWSPMAAIGLTKEWGLKVIREVSVELGLGVAVEGVDALKWLKPVSLSLLGVKVIQCELRNVSTLETRTCFIIAFGPMIQVAAGWDSLLPLPKLGPAEIGAEIGAGFAFVLPGEIPVESVFTTSEFADFDDFQFTFVSVGSASVTGLVDLWDSTSIVLPTMGAVIDVADQLTVKLEIGVETEAIFGTMIVLPPADSL